MGNKESEQAKEFHIEINHPRFLKSTILTHNAQKLLQTSQAVDQKEYDRWKQALKKYSAVPENLLLPIEHNFSRSGLCGNTGTLILTYHNYPYLLSEEIYNRKGLKTNFAQTQLWSLLFGISQAERQAGAAGERLGDVRPRNIFLNEKGSIKVANSLSWPLQNTNVQKSFDKTLTYLAPEDLDKLQRGEAVDAPSENAEAFSIGLTVLSAGNLADYEGLYDLERHELEGERLNEALKVWAFNSTYSLVLRGTVLLLLNLHAERRLTCSQLSQLLGKHAQPILKRENFVVDNAPNKLHEEIQHLRSTLAQPLYQQPILILGETAEVKPIEAEQQ